LVFISLLANKTVCWFSYYSNECNYYKLTFIIQETLRR